MRHISMQKRKPNSLRDNRPYLLAEKFELEGEESTGTLKVTGYVRGGNGTNLVPRLSVNRLVHIPGWGSYQLSQVKQYRQMTYSNYFSAFRAVNKFWTPDTLSPNMKVVLGNIL